MRNAVDIEKNVFLREIRQTALAEGEARGEARGKAEGKAEGKVEGKAEMLTQMLEMKFGALPKWARNRVEQATVAQLDRWVRKFLKADSLEAVVGPRISHAQPHP